MLEKRSPSLTKVCHRRPFLDQSNSLQRQDQLLAKPYKTRSSVLALPLSRLYHNYHHSLVAFVAAIILTFIFFHHEAVSHSSTIVDFIPFAPIPHKRQIPPRLIIPEVNGGFIYKIPKNYNRFHTLWFRPPSVRLLTPRESNYRYLYSPVRRGSSDGIGHSMGIVNLDLNLALRFNLTYTHRVADYSSLTQHDPNAVENFFAWGDNEVPRTQMQQEGCFPKNGSWPLHSSIYECNPCGPPMTNGSLAIKHVVEIPRHLGAKCRLRDSCKEESAAFATHHSESHTIFQLATSSECSPPETDAALLQTKHFFYYKYWHRHGNMPWLPPHASRKQLRAIRFVPNELNIAMHVRRGDFLLPETGRTDDIIHDEIYASLLQDTLLGIQKVGGPFSNLPVAVHIYSEGKLTKDKVRSTHDPDVQNKKYYDSQGVMRDTGWWENLIFEEGDGPSRNAARTYRSRLRFQLHISEGTLLSAHEMISADIFIGSRSGMSIYLVWSMSRGVTLVPRTGVTGKEYSQFGRLCCSVPFHKEDGRFSSSLFRRYWTAYSRANQNTIATFLTEPGSRRTKPT